MNEENYTTIAKIISNSMTDRFNIYFWTLFDELSKCFEKDDPNFDREHFFKICYRTYQGE
jgi:hypothetical protein